MKELEEQFSFTPASTSPLDTGKYVLISNPSISIHDSTQYGGGYAPGVDNGDGTFTAHIARDNLIDAMQKCIEIAAAGEPGKDSKPVKKNVPITIIKRVITFSPAGEHPKASVVMKVPGKPKITKRSSSCIHFAIGERSFIADKAVLDVSQGKWLYLCLGIRRYRDLTMSRKTLIEHLNNECLTETFTFFGVMVWAKPDELEEWKEVFHVLVDEGVIIPVEQKMLGIVYRYVGEFDAELI